MKALRLLRRGFEHGVHPAHYKEQTEQLPIQRVPFGKHYVMPLGQHIGVPSVPVVAEGDDVRRGQMIAEPGGFVSTALHSPVTGRITKVGDFRGVDGRFTSSIGIEADPFATQEVEAGEPIDWESLSLEAFIEAVQMAGIVGMGGAAFPVARKALGARRHRGFRYLLINGAECEPYLTTDHRLMVERPEALLEGLRKSLRQQAGCRGDSYRYRERTSPMPLRPSPAVFTADQPVRIVKLKVKYPQGAEKMMIKQRLRRRRSRPGGCRGTSASTLTMLARSSRSPTTSCAARR